MEINALSEGQQAQGPALPPLSSQEFRQYNHMAEHMNLYHNSFRTTWTTLYQTASTPPHSLPRSAPSIAAFIAMGTQLIHHLTIHHTIEEQHIFPVLAQRMPSFRDSQKLLAQHAEIHEGLDRLQEVLRVMRNGRKTEKEIDWAPLKSCMDSFGTVLWAHLDAEVAELGANNMRKYWSLQEMRGMPM